MCNALRKKSAVFLRYILYRFGPARQMEAQVRPQNSHVVIRFRYRPETHLDLHVPAGRALSYASILESITLIVRRISRIETVAAFQRITPSTSS